MFFKQAKYLSSYFKFEAIPKFNIPEIAFAGRSNVGKSTLINKVLNRKSLVQVSKTPGKTRALNYFEIDGKYHFVDLPGYGFAKVSKSDRDAWGKLIESYLSGSPNLKGLVHILDCRRGLTELDWTLIEFVSYINSRQDKSLQVVYVLSKADKLKSKGRSEIYRRVLAELQCDPRQLIFFSAINGQGVIEIRKIIAGILES